MKTQVIPFLLLLILAACKKEKEKTDDKMVLNNLLAYQSEEDLQKEFGEMNVSRSTGQYPEGMGTYPNTLLFAGTDNQVEIIWSDTVSRKGVLSISISGKQSDWKTKDGVMLGTTLKDLEEINGGPFSFYGFGWDYGGLAANWESGKLDGQAFSVFFDGESVPEGDEFNVLKGDQSFSSADDICRKANPKVKSISLAQTAEGTGI